MQTFYRVFFLGLFMSLLAGGFVSNIPQAQAVSSNRYSLQMMQRNVDLGYTMEFPNGEFTVGMTPELFPEPVRFTLKEVSNAKTKVKGKTLASGVYEYSFSGADMDEKRPVWVSMKLTRDIEPYRAFRIHVWDGENKEWKPIPSSMDYARGKVQGALHTPYAKVAIFEEPQIYYDLDEGRREHGFEFYDSRREFALGVFTDSYDSDKRIRMKRMDPADYAAPIGTTMVSGAVFEYEVMGRETPDRALGIRMHYTDEQDAGRWIYRWENGQWKKLSSRDDRDGNWVSMSLSDPYGIVAVFQNVDVYTGTASFYGAANADDAATHLFPIGTRLRVTNTETGASTIVVVRSTWGNANHPTRIIDLARSAFAQIEDVSQGLASVRIERAD